jgi:indolepyruvate ferredoxin oxidoreductase beta subunit
MTCDIVLVGVGGQGVLTIGELLLHAAIDAGAPASLVPTKGMAQRGGFVKVELRLGREGLGPRIGERSADLVVGTERSEALKGIRYAKPDGTFVLFDHVWEPTGVMLGSDVYPSLAQVTEAIRAATGRLVVLRPADLPTVGGRPAPSNVYVLGAMIDTAPLGELLDPSTVERVLKDRWPKVSEANVAAFCAGVEAGGGST